MQLKNFSQFRAWKFETRWRPLQAIHFLITKKHLACIYNNNHYIIRKMYFKSDKHLPASPFLLNCLVKQQIITRSSFPSRPWFTAGKRVQITGKYADTSKKLKTKWRYPSTGTGVP